MKKRVFILMLLVVFLLAMGMIVRADDLSKLKSRIEKEKGSFPMMSDLSEDALNNFIFVYQSLKNMEFLSDPTDPDSKTINLSDTAIAGIMGNIHGESSYNTSTIERGANEFKARYEASTGVGLFQWTDGRRDSFFRYAKANGDTWDLDTGIGNGKWKDKALQMDFFYEETFGPNSPSLRGWFYGADYTKSYDTEPYLIRYDEVYDSYGKENNKAFSSLKEFIDNTSLERATIIFCKGWEGPNVGDYPDTVKRRVNFAKETFAIITGGFISSGASNSASLDRQRRASRNRTTIRTDASRKELGLSKGLRGYQGPMEGLFNASGLSNTDKSESARLGFLIAQRENSKGVGNLRIVTTLLGAFMGLWGAIGFLILMVAKFADGVLYSEVIYRKMFFAGPENGGRNVLLAKEIIRPLVLIIAGILIMNGTVYEWVIQLMVLFNNLTS